MPENHEKSEVISDRPTDRQTDIVNYRVALTRLKIIIVIFHLLFTTVKYINFHLNEITSLFFF